MRLSSLSSSSSLLSFTTQKRDTNIAGAEMGQRMLSEPQSLSCRRDVLEIPIRR